jgi:hypothetical protein
MSQKEDRVEKKMMLRPIADFPINIFGGIKLEKRGSGWSQFWRSGQPETMTDFY